jgi:hypothetical protein
MLGVLCYQALLGEMVLSLEALSSLQVCSWCLTRAHPKTPELQQLTLQHFHFLSPQARTEHSLSFNREFNVEFSKTMDGQAGQGIFKIPSGAYPDGVGFDIAFGSR